MYFFYLVIQKQKTRMGLTTNESIAIGLESAVFLWVTVLVIFSLKQCKDWTQGTMAALLLVVTSFSVVAMGVAIAN
jgi:hypothetical protein